MNKVLAGILLIATLAFSIAPGHASAHVLAENNGVSAVMHIPPYDAPEAGVPTKIEFEFGTDNGGFQIADYKTSITVSNAGKAVQSSPVAAPYLGAASLGTATVTFPTIAVYDIQLTGKPTVAGKPSFVMNYSLRVATTKNAAASTMRTANASQTLYIGAAVLVLFAMFAVRQLATGGRYTKVTKQDTASVQKGHKQ